MMSRVLNKTHTTSALPPLAPALSQLPQLPIAPTLHLTVVQHSTGVEATQSDPTDLALEGGRKKQKQSPSTINNVIYLI